MTPWILLGYLPRARKILSRGRLPLLLLAVARKAAARGNLAGEVLDSLRLLSALCVAYWRGEFRAIRGQALLVVIAALLYFVAPLDALPDWLPGLGFVDDLAVLAWVMRHWALELAAFRAWRAAQSPEVIADLECLPEPDEPQAEP